MRNVGVDDYERFSCQLLLRTASTRGMGVYFELSSVPNNPSPHPQIQKDLTPYPIRL